MPDWLITGVLGLVTGLALTLLSLRHARGAELRARMLEAADDFVGAYTTAREAIEQAWLVASRVSWAASLDVPPTSLLNEWMEEYEEAAAAARRASDDLDRRQPRISLLFGGGMPTVRAAWLAHAALSLRVHELPLRPERDRDDADASARQKADRALDEFSKRAREDILRPPWPMRPLVARVRRRLRQVRRLLEQRVRKR